MPEEPREYAPALPASSDADQHLSFRFEGRASEYFRIWAVNTALTVITLGIYSAWAKVRTLRYMYGATELEGGRFDYHAEPLVILRSRVLAVVVLGLYLLASNLFPVLGVLLLVGFALLLPWLFLQARRFAMRNTSYRNIRFSFAGEWKDAFTAMIAAPILSALTLGLAWPYARWLRARLIVDSSWWGSLALRSKAEPGDFYLAYFVVGLAGAGLFALIAAVLNFIGVAVLDPGAGPDPSLAGALGLAGMVVLYLVGGAFLAGWLQGAILRATLDGMHVGPHRLAARFAPWGVAWIAATNALAILISLGLLIPWARIRRYRYQLERIECRLTEPLDRVEARVAEEVGAMGEEAGEVFDLDFGV